MHILTVLRRWLPHVISSQPAKRHLMMSSLVIVQAGINSNLPTNNSYPRIVKSWCFSRETISSCDTLLSPTSQLSVSNFSRHSQRLRNGQWLMRQCRFESLCCWDAEIEVYRLCVQVNSLNSDSASSWALAPSSSEAVLGLKWVWVVLYDRFICN